MGAGLFRLYGCWFPSSTCRSVFMHELANAVLFLQYFYVLFLGLPGLVEVLVSMRCSLPWLANLMLFSVFLFCFPRCFCQRSQIFQKYGHHFKNSRLRKGDMWRVPYWGLTNSKRPHTRDLSACGVGVPLWHLMMSQLDLTVGLFLS